MNLAGLAGSIVARDKAPRAQRAIAACQWHIPDRERLGPSFFGYPSLKGRGLRWA